MINLERLNSGLSIVTEAMPAVRSASVGIWIGTGSREEPKELGGASHFLEHLLYKGTTTRSSKQIAEDLDSVGGDSNAFTSREHTAFYVRLLADDIELGLDILCDILCDPALREDDVELERLVILEEIFMHADEPSELAWERCFQACYGDHSLGRDVQGSAETVSTMTRDSIRSFWSEHYGFENMVVAVAGAIDHERIVEGVQKRMNLSSAKPPERIAPGEFVASREWTHRPIEQANVVMAMPAFGRKDERRWALALLNHVLGGGLSSRLFQEIRENRGLVYSIGCDWSGFSDAGLISTSFGTSPDKVDTVIDLVNEQYKRISESGIAARELELARANLKAETLLAYEDSGSRMARLANSTLYQGHVMEIDEVLEKMLAVSLDDIGVLAADIFAGPQIVSIVGPEKS
ncbi:MAG: insulinase family protein [Acidimicrobiales bacterium]|nr:insulinase family protein [Acidimicrobiales bacterium]